MTDSEFMAFMHGLCYAQQAEGYSSTSVPDGFLPIVPCFKNDDGTINRARTIEGYGISEAERKRLLALPTPPEKRH